MYSNTELIKAKLKELTAKTGIMVFSSDDYYIQFSAYGPPGELYYEAVSYEYLDTITEALTASFKAMGFGIDRGNYFKTVTVKSDADYESIANECERIFIEFYRVNYNTPLAFEEFD